MGPLISEKEAKRVQSWVEEAVKRGSTILYDLSFLWACQFNGLNYAPLLLLGFLSKSVTFPRHHVYMILLAVCMLSGS